MNHFFALPIPTEAAKQLAQLAAQWQALLPKRLRVRWEDPENYHITLNFLGNLSPVQQPRLIKAAAPVAPGLWPSVVHVTRIGAFPNTRQPGVLWAGLVQQEETANLAIRIDAALLRQGFDTPKHVYVPHITLGRCRAEENTEDSGSLQTTLPIQVVLPVNGFVLMETLPLAARRKDRPVRYNTVHTFPWGDTPL